MFWGTTLTAADLFVLQPNGMILKKNQIRAMKMLLDTRNAAITYIMSRLPGRWPHSQAFIVLLGMCRMHVRACTRAVDHEPEAAASESKPTASLPEDAIELEPISSRLLLAALELPLVRTSARKVAGV